MWLQVEDIEAVAFNPETEMLVVTLPLSATPDDSERIDKALQEYLGPDVKIVVLHGGTTLAVEPKS